MAVFTAFDFSRFKSICLYLIIAAWHLDYPRALLEGSLDPSLNDFKASDLFMTLANAITKNADRSSDGLNMLDGRHSAVR